MIPVSVAQPVPVYPGWAGAHGGADLRPAPRAPGRNLRPAPRAPVRPGPHPGHDTWVTPPHHFCLVPTRRPASSRTHPQYHRLLIWPGRGQAAGSLRFKCLCKHQLSRTPGPGRRHMRRRTAAPRAGKRQRRRCAPPPPRGVSAIWKTLRICNMERQSILVNEVSNN